MTTWRPTLLLQLLMLLLLHVLTAAGACTGHYDIDNMRVSNEEDKITYACHSGFTLDPSHRVENFCMGESYWAFDHPTCIRNRCGRLPDVDSAYGCYGNDYWCRGTVDSDYRQNVYEAKYTVPYTCRPGYVINGESKTTMLLTCMDDGTWSHTDIMCSEIRCLIPATNAKVKPIVKNKFNDGWDEDFFRDLDVVTVSCPADSTRRGGDDSLTCREGEWSGDFPQCKGHCPSTLNHGHYTCKANRWQRRWSKCTSNQLFKDADTRRATCDYGYEMVDVDDNTGYTCSDGVTDKIASCTPKGCVRCVGCSGLPHKTAHDVNWDVTCSHTYKPAVHTTTCQLGRWDPDPPCKKYCGVVSSARMVHSPRPTEGDYILSGDNVFTSCTAGFDLFEGLTVRPSGVQRTCNRFGVIKLVNCFARCSSTLEHGSWTCRQSSYSNHWVNCTREHFKHNDKRRTTCDNGYENVDAPNRYTTYTCSDGELDKTASCTPKRCDVCDGCSGQNPKTDHRESWDVTCSDGYKPEATVETATCIYGTWSHEKPCKKFCSVVSSARMVHSPSPTAGDYILSDDNVFTSCTADFDLFEGRTFRSSRVQQTCNRYGVTELTPQVNCFARCSSTLEHGSWTCRQSRYPYDWVDCTREHFKHNDERRTTCDTDYENVDDPNGDTTYTCSDGELDPTASCTPKRCDRCDGCSGRYTKTDHREAWDVTCSYGYKPTVETATCIYGTWSPEKPCKRACMLREAHMQYDPASSFIFVDSHARVWCADGYDLFQDNTNLSLRSIMEQTCNMDGTLSPRMTCYTRCTVPRLTNVRWDGNVGSVTHSSGLGYICDPGYVGDGEATCNNGQWSSEPHCVPVRYCDVPTIPNSQAIIEDKVPVNENITIRCESGRKMLLPNGKWRQQKTFTCEVEENNPVMKPNTTNLKCQDPGVVEDCYLPQVENALPHSEKLEPGSTINISCLVGFELWTGYVKVDKASTSVPITCLDSGKFDIEDLPSCSAARTELEHCDRAPNVNYFVDNKLWTGCTVLPSDDITAECIDGFGSSMTNISVSCGEDGQWNNTFSENQNRSCQCPAEERFSDCSSPQKHSTRRHCPSADIWSTCTDGTWEPAACTNISIVTCGCVPPQHYVNVRVNNILWSADQQLVPVGAADVTCLDNSTNTVTSSNVTCLPSGHWSTDLQHCLPHACVIPARSGVTYRDNSEVLVVGAAGTERAHGDIITYSCSERHNVNITCHSGEWLPEILDCNSDCEVPDAPDSVTYASNGKQAGDQTRSSVGLYYPCSSSRNGWKHVMCSHGRWQEHIRCP